MRRYLAEIALNKDGKSITQIFEMPEYPCTLKEMVDAEKEMFNYLQTLFDKYRKGCADKNLLHMCHFEDWQREMARHQYTNTICWSCDRNINAAHITIFNL